MAASRGGVLLIVGIFIAACQADFGLSVDVPNLRDQVSQAIGSGVEPLLEAKLTLTFDTSLDESGSLGAVVSVINGVSASVGRVFNVTQTVVLDSSTPGVTLFTELFDSFKQAADDLENAVSATKVFKNCLTVQAINSNINTIKYQERELSRVFKRISNKLEEAQNSSAFIGNDIVGNYVTPELVDSLTKCLTAVKSRVDNLADLLTNTVRKRVEVISNISTVNATANEAQRLVVEALSTFYTNTETSSKTIVQNLENWTSTVEASFSQIINSSAHYNRGDITNLLSYLDKLNNSRTDFVGSVTRCFRTLQTKVFGLLKLQTAIATDALYSTTKTVVYTDLSSVQSQNPATCPTEYVDKLKLPLVQVSRFTSCLSSEETTILGYYTVLAPLLQQLQNNAVAINVQQIGTCIRRDGPCSSVYFASYETLSQQVAEQLDNLNDVLKKELQFLRDRIDTCIRATTADIVDNLKTLTVTYNDCLNKLY